MAYTLPLDVERQIHALLCGSVDEPERQEILSLIAANEGTRTLLMQQLNEQQRSRAAFGYDSTGETIRLHMRRFKASLGVRGSPARPSFFRQVISARWLVRSAAVVAIVASMYVAITARHSSRMAQEQLAKIGFNQARIEAAITLTAADLARYQQIWGQVAEGDNTWILLGDGGGEFGTLDAGSAGRSNNRILLIQIRVLGEDERCVYSASLLVPDRPTLNVTLPNAGAVGGRQASLTVDRSGEAVTVGLSLSEQGAAAVGVTAYKLINDQTDEIGRFLLHDRTLRIIARTRRLVGRRTDKPGNV